MAWRAVFGSLIVAGLAWLSTAYSESDANDFGAATFRPIAGSIRTESDPGAPRQSRHPLDEALAFVQPSLEALKDVDDYTAVFTKAEVVRGKPVTQTIDMKFRERPFSVYLRGRSKSKAGREIIYVAGWNDGKLMAHETGFKSFLGTLNLTPEAAMRLESNRHPITEIGIARMLDTAIAIWQQEKQTVDPADIEVRIVHNVKVGDRDCDLVEAFHPRQQPELTYQVGRIYIDRQSRLPVQAELFGWPANSGDEAPLLEKYTYDDIRTNVGLSDNDFDPRNADYRFAVN